MAKVNQKIVDGIVANGVKNLKEFGYPSVDKDNILTDEVYKMFFKNMLKENLGNQFDTEINHLIEQIGE